jgi:pectate lyase
MPSRALVRSLVAAVVGVVMVHIDVVPFPLFTTPMAAAGHAPAEGYGATTPGGTGQAEYRVTSLQDSGPGTLREAVSRGSRRVVFDVAGTIALESPIEVLGSFLTIDATTAPGPGITLSNYGLGIRGKYGAHDVVVRGLRVRQSSNRRTDLNNSNDCVSISHGAYNILIDHVSTSGCEDGGIDIVGLSTQETRDVTVQWSVIGNTWKAQLLKYGTHRISLHHNLYVQTWSRNPAITRENQAVLNDITVDLRNNVMWDWAGGVGTGVGIGARVNVVNNFYGNPSGAANDQDQALVPDPQSFTYASGNLSYDGVDIDAKGNVATAYDAAPVTTTTAACAAHQVVQSVGAQPRDTIDAGYLALVALPPCSETSPTASTASTSTSDAPSVGLPNLVMPSLSAPSVVRRGAKFGLDFTIANGGGAAAGPSKLRIYVARETRRSRSDVEIRVRNIEMHEAGAVSVHGISEYVPREIRPGQYYLLFVLDANRQVVESNEADNIVAQPVRIR